MSRWINVEVRHNGQPLLQLQTDSIQLAVTALGSRLEKLIVDRRDLVEVKFEVQG